jgi:hypothetical protein
VFDSETLENYLPVKAAMKIGCRVQAMLSIAKMAMRCCLQMTAVPGLLCGWPCQTQRENAFLAFGGGRLDRSRVFISVCYALC